MALNFTCLTEEEVRWKYNNADDKRQIIEVIAGLTCSTKREVMEFLGLKPPQKPQTTKPSVRKPKGKIDHEKAKRLHSIGYSDAEIARRLVVTKAAIGNWRRQHGIEANISETKQDNEAERMELYLKGLNDAQIGAELGLSSKAIYGWRSRRGLPPNTGWGGIRRNKKEEKECSK